MIVQNTLCKMVIANNVQKTCKEILKGRFKEKEEKCTIHKNRWYFIGK